MHILGGTCTFWVAHAHSEWHMHLLSGTCTFWVAHAHFEWHMHILGGTCTFWVARAHFGMSISRRFAPSNLFSVKVLGGFVGKSGNGTCAHAKWHMRACAIWRSPGLARNRESSSQIRPLSILNITHKPISTMIASISELRKSLGFIFSMQ